MSTRLAGPFVAVVLVVLLAASPAHAQGVGFVGGGTIDPEQFYVGTFFETPQLSQNVRVRPGVDGSWGGDLRSGTHRMETSAWPSKASDEAGWQ